MPFFSALLAVLSALSVHRYKHTKTPTEAYSALVMARGGVAGVRGVVFISIPDVTPSQCTLYMSDKGAIRWILGVFFSHNRQVRPWYLHTSNSYVNLYRTQEVPLSNLKKEPQHVSARHLRSSRREALAGSRMQSQVSDQSGHSDRGEPRQGRGRVAP